MLRMTSDSVHEFPMQPTHATAHPVKVGVCPIALLVIGLGHVVVDDNIDALDIDSAAHEVRRHQDALVALLEQLVRLDALLLRKETAPENRNEIM